MLYSLVLLALFCTFLFVRADEQGGYCGTASPFVSARVSANSCNECKIGDVDLDCCLIEIDNVQFGGNDKLVLTGSLNIAKIKTELRNAKNAGNTISTFMGIPGGYLRLWAQKKGDLDIFWNVCPEINNQMTVGQNAYVSEIAPFVYIPQFFGREPVDCNDDGLMLTREQLEKLDDSTESTLIKYVLPLPILSGGFEALYYKAFIMHSKPDANVGNTVTEQDCFSNTLNRYGCRYLDGEARTECQNTAKQFCFNIFNSDSHKTEYNAKYDYNNKYFNIKTEFTCVSDSDETEHSSVTCSFGSSS